MEENSPWEYENEHHPNAYSLIHALPPQSKENRTYPWPEVLPGCGTHPERTPEDVGARRGQMARDPGPGTISVPSGA